MCIDNAGTCKICNALYTKEGVKSLNQLNAATLKNLIPSSDLKVVAANNLPERVIQLGEGNFLRAFVDGISETMKIAHI